MDPPNASPTACDPIHIPEQLIDDDDLEEISSRSTSPQTDNQNADKNEGNNILMFTCHSFLLCRKTKLIKNKTYLFLKIKTRLTLVLS